MNFGIIAAGEGSRLAQEGVEYPKPLVRLGGEPMIGRLLRIFDSLGAEQVSVITNEKMPEVAEYVRDVAPSLGARVELIVKSTPSSMHSFYEISRTLRSKGRFIVTTVDTIFDEADFHRYAETFASAPADVDGVMAVTSYIDDEKPLYVETDAAMDILAFRDSAWEEARYVSGGIYGLDSQAIDVLEDCMAQGVSRMRNFQRALVAAGLHLKACDMGKIMDVDHASDIAKAEAFIKSKK